MADQLITVADVMRLLGISRHAVHIKIYAGRLRAAKVPRPETMDLGPDIWALNAADVFAYKARHDRWAARQKPVEVAP